MFHVKGGKRLAKSICNKCVKCRMAAARASTQLLGQLPPARVEPNYVFLHTGLDLAGPFYIRKGHTRRPVVVKCYLIIFICFCTKAVHLELVSDQTKEAFLAALDRFVTRRGLPLHIYSDHTVKNGVFQNSYLGCLNVHSSTTPNRVFLKPPFEGVTGHPKTPLQLAVNHSKGCYANTYTLLILNCMSL